MIKQVFDCLGGEKKLIAKLIRGNYQTRAKPGAALQTPLSLVHSFIHSFSEPFPPTALQRRHAQTVRDRASSYKLDYVIVTKNFLNPEGHQNPISGSKVTAILLKGWILLIGGASAGEGLPCSLRSRLVFTLFGHFSFFQIAVLNGI